MPRKIIGAAFLSLDGIMQAPGGPEEDRSGGFAYGGWWEPQSDEELGRKIGALFDRPFDLLLGRRTYDIFAAYWPFQKDSPIGTAFDQAGKYVLTHSSAPLQWAGSHRLAGIDAVASLKEQDGPDLLIQGSSTLYPQLLAHGLLDRLDLMIGPLMLGKGKRLFGEGTPPGALRLIDHAVTSKGVVMATYEPTGPVLTGSFVTQAPSKQELMRREKIAQGSW
jgi:dihydrofolate reductase